MRSASLAGDRRQGFRFVLDETGDRLGQSWNEVVSPLVVAFDLAPCREDRFFLADQAVVYQDPGNYRQHEQKQESECDCDDVVHVAWAPDLIERCSHVLHPLSSNVLRTELGADDGEGCDTDCSKPIPGDGPDRRTSTIHAWVMHFRR
ncbi:MAG: hypothetical protein H6Q33_5167 [Deltaproteobacteria bacterium]|nr:hypothetical protein [Deltaproteobacteria bacterium]